jgi:hypothetical protein
MNVNKFFSDAARYSERNPAVISAGHSFESIFLKTGKEVTANSPLRITLKPQKNSLSACRPQHPVLQLIPV